MPTLKFTTNTNAAPSLQIDNGAVDFVRGDPRIRAYDATSFSLRDINYMVATSTVIIDNVTKTGDAYTIAGYINDLWPRRSAAPAPANNDNSVTSVNSKTPTAGNVSLTQDDIPDGTNSKQYSATDKAKLAAITGNNTGDQDLSGKADLVAGKVPASQLPSFVDDVLEFANLAGFPSPGETGKIYIAQDTNLEYRWSGSTYINIAKGAVQSVNTQTGVVTLTQDNIPDGTNAKQYTPAEKNKLAAISGTNTGDQDLSSYVTTTYFNQNKGTPVVEVTSTSQQLAVNTRYIANNAGLVTLPLPATANQGDQIYVRGKGAGGWKVTQNAGQKIHGATDTTTGTGGSIASQARYDTLALECITAGANTEWIIISKNGTLTIV